MQQYDSQPLVFLDTNVVAAYIRGESPSSRLFSDEIRKKLRLAINPIVLQELLFLPETQKNPERLDQLQQQVEMLYFNYEKAEEYFKNASDLRNRGVHASDVLILSSAAECDYLITYDQILRSLSSEKLEILTPEQLQQFCNRVGSF
ncbi:type II toxin-antitoxin system VapC family toxin [Gloeothece verrucosa]|uniref:PilT protein domain protein n=1 Tax=Gloeothece verrucosa (strain PCC 7822) TaxID=497965 RepID=E0U9C7_GLOV7|nr:PIN domain-containing protein [Gloeothece verrucosa]ADN12619.1 PilT protein domain protein [Gloeothece verrucosa PCC 7822]